MEGGVFLATGTVKWFDDAGRYGLIAPEDGGKDLFVRHTNIAGEGTAGKMRRYRIRMAPGDRISVQLSSYDLTRGRIVYRHR